MLWNSVLTPLQEKPNPEYSIIDRIVDKRVTKGKQKHSTYLVKWRGLPYEECTWEEEDSLTSKEDKERVQAYNGMYLLLSHGYWIQGLILLYRIRGCCNEALKQSSKSSEVFKNHGTSHIPRW